jgi:hypothetical protein
MDLWSAHRNANWHPLTSLVTMQSEASGRSLYLVPVMDYPVRSHLSTFLHEVAHAWTARNTRLGFALSRSAAELFLAWDQMGRTGPVHLPLTLTNLLGTFQPLFEGIALIAELDYGCDLEGDAIPLPCPLNLVGQYYLHSIMPTSGRVRDIFPLLRREVQGMAPLADDHPTREHYGDERPSLINALLLNNDRLDLVPHLSSSIA